MVSVQLVGDRIVFTDQAGRISKYDIFDWSPCTLYVDTPEQVNDLSLDINDMPSIQNDKYPRALCVYLRETPNIRRGICFINPEEFKMLFDKVCELNSMYLDPDDD